MPLAIGGIVDIENIVGRDAQAYDVLHLLNTQHGAVLTGDRRVGKTSLARLVEHHLRLQNHRVIRISAERETYGDFLDALARSMTRMVDGPIAAELKRLRVELNVGPVAISRSGGARVLDELIEKAIPDDDGRRLVLIIDEIPVLAMAMERAEPGSGTDLLRTLRRIRQDNSGKLAMLLLGSIGFHHVTTDVSGTMNDVTPVSIGAIGRDDARYLAHCLLLGAFAAGPDAAAVASAIADAAESVPYYVQFLVKAYRDERHRQHHVGPADIPALVQTALTDEDDPWNMRHYRERIALYYGREKAPLVEAILNEYASAPTVSVDRVLQGLLAGGEFNPPCRELVRLVERLEQDHYIARQGDASTFRSELVRQAWLRGMRQ